MAKTKGRADKFRDPDEQITKDHDPEANGPQSGSDSESSGDDNAGTEHYVSVGKSKMRQKEGVSLGSHYRGARVARDALEDEDEYEDEAGDSSDVGDEYDDPETADVEADAEEATDSEIESDDALAESDDERLGGFAFRGSSKPAKTQERGSKRAMAADYMSSSDEEAGSGGAGVEDEEDEDEDGDEMSGVELGETDDDDMDDGGGASDVDEDAEEDDTDRSGDDASEDDADESESGGAETSGTRAQDTKPIMAALSNRADVDKGTAIQQQRKIYDGLLNLRIRLQKALVASNTFPVVEPDLESTSEPYEAAEEAAVKLLNTIGTLKDSFGTSATTGDKRKRDFNVSMPSEEMWGRLQEEDEADAKSRDARLEKWSRKVQSVNLSAAKGLGARNKTLIDALQEQLNNSGERLAKRTRVPRSCAPAQAAKKTAEENEDIYDDADFYQLLLKDLVDQRTLESGSAPGAQAGAASVMVTAATREAKARRNVDRKASKGRKMRFTVHEKLQNFMAPEDRRSWEQGAVDRFFGALFGRRLGLDEDDEEDEARSDNEDADGLRAEEEGLRLFRS